VLGGIIRGVGLQSRAFWISLVCYYFIGIPIGAYLMFKTDLALKGTWIGIAICSLCVNISFATLLIRSKWNKI
jgi:MATE family multidrug resistance protein